MTTEVQTDLARRLDALEAANRQLGRANRRLRASLVAALLAAATAALVGAAQPPPAGPKAGPVTATGFHLVGDDGGRRAELVPHGKSAKLVLLDEGGKPAVVVVGDEQGAGPKVQLSGPDGQVWFVVTGHWLIRGKPAPTEPQLIVQDRKGNPIGAIQKH